MDVVLIICIAAFLAIVITAVNIVKKDECEKEQQKKQNQQK